MRPVDFKTANTTFGKPENMSDEQCTPLRAEVGVDINGFPYICSAWMPNIDDLAAINRGEPIYIKVVSNSLPPMAIFTIDNEGNSNED